MRATKRLDWLDFFKTWTLALIATFGIGGPLHAQEPAATSAAYTPPSLETFLAQSTIVSASMSPDGTKLVGVRYIVGGEVIVVIDLTSGAAAAVQTARYDRGMSINWVQWKTNDRLVFSVQTFVDRRGSPISRAEAFENLDKAYVLNRVLSTNSQGQGLVPMFFGERRVPTYANHQWVDSLRGDPAHILLKAPTDEDERLWKVNIYTGEAIVAGVAGFSTQTWWLDGEDNAVLRLDSITRTSGERYLRRRAGSLDWTRVIDIRKTENTNSYEFVPLGAGPGANQVYVIAQPEGQDRSALYIFDTATGEYGAPIVSHPSADIIAAAFDPKTRQVIQACAETKRLECVSPDASVTADWALVSEKSGPERTATFQSASEDGNIWSLFVGGPRDRGAFYIFDRTTKTLRKVIDLNADLKRASLGVTEVMEYKSRDGTDLWAYLTMPPASEGTKPALILMPHGGPESRDTTSFDQETQVLATRGYAVLRPHFRGSSGSGKAFAAAGFRQWGKRMQDDLTDAVNTALATGRFDPNRVCIVGGSYGGYAALAGATFTPDLYKCAVSVAGISDLERFLIYQRQQETSGKSDGFSYWRRSIGELGADEAMLAETSPARHAGAIKIPVLLVHGDQDLTVPIEQSEIMAKALTATGRQHRFVRIANEAHGGWDSASTLTYYKELLAFLESVIPPPAPPPGG